MSVDYSLVRISDLNHMQAWIVENQVHTESIQFFRTVLSDFERGNLDGLNHYLEESGESHDRKAAAYVTAMVENQDRLGWTYRLDIYWDQLAWMLNLLAGVGGSELGPGPIHV